MESRNYLANASATPPAEPASPSTGYPRAGVPGVSEATKLGSYWFYQVGEELRNVILSAGLTPDYGDLTQVATAIQALASIAAPTGSVIAYAASTAPLGFLKCNGAAVSRTTYATLFARIGTTFGSGDGSTTFNVPELRGEFIRGFDETGLVDAGRVLGSWQDGQMPAHIHTLTRPYYDANAGSGWTDRASGSVLQTYPTSSTGGTSNSSENRPRNVALLYCIKY